MPQGQYPGILPGQELTAALLNSMTPLGAWKTSATTYTSTSFVADPDLQVPVAANAQYGVDVYVPYATGSTANNSQSFEFTAPAGAAVFINGTYYSGGSVNLSGNLGLSTARGFDGKSTTIIPLILSGTLITGGTAGTFGMSFEVTTAGNTLILQPGSRMSLKRLQ